MISRIALSAVVCVSWVLACGCDRGKPAAPSQQPARKTVAPPTAFGTIKGRVKLLGWDKKPAPIPDDCCKLGPNDLVDETVVQDEQRNLQYVVLSVQDCPMFGEVRTEPAILDQIKCRFAPHVVAVQVGQPLDVKNSDQTIHNVHMVTEKNPPVNIGMQRPETRRFSMTEAEIFPVKCDVHPWMKAYIAVFNHPCFAVSAADGTFEIKKAPAGKSILSAWHEKFGEIEQEIVVPVDGTVTVELTYKAPRE